MSIILQQLSGQPAFIYARYADGVTVTATDTKTGSSATNLLQPDEDTGWAPANTTGDKAVTLVLPQSITADTLALCGTGLDNISVEVAYSTDQGSTWTTPAEAQFTLAADLNAAWAPLPSNVADHWKITFSGFGSDFAVQYLALCQRVPLPYLAEDPDPARVQVEGTPLVSAAGYYVGACLQRSMRELPLDLGQLTDGEYSALGGWIDDCVTPMRAFFFVPDNTSEQVFFGWLKDSRFAAPRKNGLRDPDSLTFVTRAA